MSRDACIKTCFTELCRVRLKMCLLLLAAFIGCVKSNEDWHFTGLNVALNKVTKQLPGTDASAESHRAVDGRNGSCTQISAASNAPAYWSVDLNGSYILKGIRIYNMDINKERLDNFQVIGYPTETTLHDYRLVQNKLSQESIINIPVYSTTSFSNITINIPAHESPPDNGSFFLCEVEIYTGIKIALAPSSTSNGPITADASSFAADGNMSGRCARSVGFGRNSFWSVDLGQEYQITSIIIHPDSSLQRDLKGFSVLGYPGAELVYNDSLAQVKLYLKPVIQVPVTSAKQFSKIRIEVSPFVGIISELRLCEVEIIAELSYCYIPYTCDSSKWILQPGTGYVNTFYELITAYSVFDVSCNTNFHLIGKNRIQCLSNGTYNNDIPRCVGSQCRKPQFNSTQIQETAGQNSATLVGVACGAFAGGVGICLFVMFVILKCKKSNDNTPTTGNAVYSIPDVSESGDAHNYDQLYMNTTI